MTKRRDLQSYVCLFLFLALSHQSQGLITQMCLCKNVLGPPMPSNCSVYLTECPCNGGQEATLVETSLLNIIQSHEKVDMYWFDVPMSEDFRVFYNLSANSQEMSVTKNNTEPSNELLFGTASNYTLKICGMLFKTYMQYSICNCAIFTVRKANEFVPEAPKFESSTNRVVWNQPTTADGLLDYQVSYSVYNSNEEPILAMNTTEVFTELTGKLLPSTWYTANVTAFYDTNSYFSSDILLFQTEGSAETSLFRLHDNSIFSINTGDTFKKESLCGVDPFTIFSLRADSHPSASTKLVNGLVTSADFDMSIRRMYYTTVNGTIESVNIKPGDIFFEVVGASEEFYAASSSMDLRSISYNWALDHIYWIENGKVMMKVLTADTVVTVLSLPTQVSQIRIDPVYLYLYFLSDGVVRRCPMNQNIDCYENSINVAGDITEVVDFTINYTKKLLYRTNRTVFSVSDLDGENEIVRSLFFESGAAVSLLDDLIAIVTPGNYYELWNSGELTIFCNTSTLNTGLAYGYSFNERNQPKLIVPEPPRNFQFIVNPGSINVSWISPSEGVPMYAPNALWFYQLSLNNSDETITATSFSRNSLASGPFSFSVTVEGQPPSVKVSPDFMVFIPETEVTVPKLLFGQTNGLWRATVLQSSVSFEELQATSAISSLAHDVLRNKTYFTTSKDAFVVYNGKIESITTASNDLSSVSIDWVSNTLYWIESQTKVKYTNVDDINEKKFNFDTSAGNVTSIKHIAVDPVRGLLFYVTGDNNVNFAKLNGLTPRGMAKCNIYMDQVVSLALDLSRQRVYWATVTHDKVIVNWADYADENCINIGASIIPQFSLSSEGSQSHVTIAISDYTLAVVFGSQKEVWTTDIRVFDTLTTISSAGFTKAELNTAIVTSAVFETLEVSQDFNATNQVIPGAPTGIAQDGSDNTNTITIQWTGPTPEFKLSDLVYVGQYTLTNETATSYGTLKTPNRSLTIPGQAYVLVNVTLKAVSLWGASESVNFQFRSSTTAPLVQVRDVNVLVYKATRGSDNVSVVVSWSPLSVEELRGELQSYLLTFTSNSADDFNLSVTDGRTSVLLNSDEFTYGATYSVQVEAINQVGSSPKSDIVNFTVQATPSPLEVLLVGSQVSRVTPDGTLMQMELASPVAFDVKRNALYGILDNSLVKLTYPDGVTVWSKDLPSGMTAESLSLDWIAQVLYITLSDSGSIAIYRLSAEYSDSDFINVFNGRWNSNITGTSLSPFNGNLYFVRSMQLEKLDLVSYKHSVIGGSSRRRKRVAPTGLTSALAVDSTVEPQRIWIGQSSPAAILSCPLTDLNNCVTEVQSPAMGLPPTSIAVDDSTVYWILGNSNVIYYVLKNDTANVLNLTSTTPGDQVVVSGPASQPLPREMCLYPPQAQQPTVTASAVADKTAQLSWNAAVLPPECDSEVVSLAPVLYTVRLYTPDYVIDINAGFSTTLTLDMDVLVPVTEYAVQVSGVNVYTPLSLLGGNLFGPNKTFVTLEGVPEKPRDLSVVSYGTDGLQVTWQRPAETFSNNFQDTYNIVVDGKEVRNVTGKTTTIIKNLQAGTEYEVTVAAYNSLHIGLSDTRSGTTWPPPPTLRPSNRTSTSVSLMATFSTTHLMIQSVMLQQRQDDEMWKIVSGTMTDYNVGDISFNVTSLEPNTNYYFRLLGSYEMLGGNPHSASGVSTNVTTEPGIPSKPVVGIEGNNLVFTESLEDNGAPITEYCVFYFLLPNGPEENRCLPYDGNERISLLAHNDLSNGSMYNVSVALRNMKGLSLRSNSLIYIAMETDTTADTTLPPAIIAGIAGGLAALVIVLLVSFCVILCCCCVWWRSYNRKIPIAVYMLNRNYDEDLQRLRVLKFNRDDYRSRQDYVYNKDDLDRLEKIPREQITLESHLGEGAFGEVYKGSVAVGDEPSIPVAIKVLHKDFTEEQQRSFLSEAIIMSHFNHENILKVIGVCLNNVPTFIILELMEGGSLIDFLKGARREGGSQLLTPLELAKISLDVAKGGKYLEALKFIHRDLAARNCLVSSKSTNRVVKIGDFGLAKDLYSHEYYRKEGQGLLPVRWMPPESLQEGLFTSKSDVWAFGVTLWEIYTLGFQPYPARTNHEVFEFVIHGGRNERPDRCPTYIYNLMVQCWQHNADDRPAFLQLVEKLNSFHDHLVKREEDEEGSDYDEESGGFKREGSNHSWFRESFRNSIRRIRSSIHRQNSIRRQSSIKGDTPINGQAFKESGPI